MDSSLRGTGWAMAAVIMAIGCGDGAASQPDASDQAPPSLDETLQWGSTGEDAVRGAALSPTGDVYLTGYAMGAIGDNSYAGSVDIFLTKVSGTGTLAWTRQHGTSDWDQPFAVASAPTGDIYVTGGTFGELAGHTPLGNGDVFLMRFAADGSLVWTEVWGTSEEDIGYAVAVDHEGGIYVVGWTSGDLAGTNAGATDNFLTKLDRDGTRLWSRQWGSEAFEDPAAAAVDSHNNVYITGKTGAGLDGNPLVGTRDVFLTRFASDGTKHWTRQWGNGHFNNGRGIAIADDDSIYVAGYLLPLDSFAGDVFVTRLDDEGAELWTESYGTYEIENGWAVDVDRAGNVFVTGKTLADLEGNINAGGYCGYFPCADTYLTKLNEAGERLWTKQWGSASDDYGSAVVVADDGTIFVAGGTSGDLNDASFGDRDAFLSIFPAAR